MPVSARFEAKQAFVLRSPQIRSIWTTIQQHIGPVEAEASCVDGIERTFASLDELLQYENPRTRAITKLSFQARSSDRSTRCRITFGGRYSATIEATASGLESSVTSWRTAMEEIIDGCRPWYSPIARVDFFTVVWALLMLSIVVVTPMVDFSKKNQPMEFSQALVNAAKVFLFMATVALTTVALNRLRQRFFPIATFVIGQGEARFAFEENIRWIVIMGFLVSTFASLVVAFLWG